MAFIWAFQNCPHFTGQGISPVILPMSVSIMHFGTGEIIKKCVWAATGSTVRWTWAKTLLSTISLFSDWWATVVSWGSWNKCQFRASIQQSPERLIIPFSTKHNHFGSRSLWGNLREKLTLYILAVYWGPSSQRPGLPLFKGFWAHNRLKCGNWLRAMILCFCNSN